MLKTSLAALLLALVLQPANYTASVEAFHKAREADIGGEMGWASLTGLHWLANGTRTIGRGAANAIVLTAPSAPNQLGTLTVTDDAALLHVAAGVPVRVRGKLVTEAQLAPSTSLSDSVTVGGMTMIVIKRGSRLALRVWDVAAPTRVAFTGLRWNPIDPKWRIDATFVSHQPVPHARIQNILNETVEMANPGVITFAVGGHEYQLEALLEEDDSKELFFMFRDGTSGKTTYGAGRYLYTALPKNGHVTIDFNLAVNPPCAFTAFATCPLPLAKNRLTLAVDAGELDHKH